MISKEVGGYGELFIIVVSGLSDVKGVSNGEIKMAIV